MQPGRTPLPSKPQPGRDEQEARRILERVAQEADGSRMAAPDPRPGADPDWIEETGTRIGRLLGPLILLACALWLLFHLVRGS